MTSRDDLVSRHVMETEHEKNDDNDNDGSSGTTDGHDHFEEEDDE